MALGSDKRGIDFSDLQMYLAIAHKHLRLMVLLVAMWLLTGLNYYIWARPVFSSKSLIRFQSMPLIGDVTKVKDERNPFEVLDQLKSPALLSKVEEKLGNKANEFGPKKLMLGKVEAMFNAEQNIELQVGTYNQDWPKKFPELLISTFNEEREERRNLYKEEFLRRLESEKQLFDRRIQEAFFKESQFKETNDFEKVRLELEELRDIPRFIIQSRQRLADMDGLRLKLQNQSLSILQRLALLSNFETDLKIGDSIQSAPGSSTNRSETRFIIVPSMMPSQTREWERLEREHIQLTKAYNENAKVFRDGHPRMMGLKRQLDLVNNLLKGEIETAEYRFAAAHAKEKSRLLDLEAKEPHLNDLTKRFASNQLLLLAVTSGQKDWERYSEESMRKIREVDNFSDKERFTVQFITRLETRDVVPVSPNRLKLVLQFLAIGIAFAIGIPFLIEFLDQTAGNLDKVEQLLQVRSLGIIPKFSDTIKESYPVIRGENGTGGNLLEAFRVLRTNLLSAAALSKAPQVILVTSAMPKEGKTVIASNLGAAFAQLGEKTLIVDANFRRGLVHHPFRVRSSPGLSNILIDRISIEEACRPTDFDNLTVLPCGEHLDGDIEQLGSPLFAKLIEKLRQKYHRIIIDCPPVLGLSETAVMQPCVDGVVFLVQAGVTPMRAAKTAVDILQSNHANFYGFVLNGLDLGVTMHRFQYYYYANHYYNRYTALEKVS